MLLAAIPRPEGVSCRSRRARTSPATHRQSGPAGRLLASMSDAKKTGVAGKFFWRHNSRLSAQRARTQRRRGKASEAQRQVRWERCMDSTSPCRAFAYALQERSTDTTSDTTLLPTRNEQRLNCAGSLNVIPFTYMLLHVTSLHVRRSRAHPPWDLSMLFPG